MTNRRSLIRLAVGWECGGMAIAFWAAVIVA